MKDQEITNAEEEEEVNHLLTDIQNLKNKLQECSDFNLKYELSKNLIKSYSVLRNKYEILNSNQEKDYRVIINQSLHQEINDLEEYSLGHIIKKELISNNKEIKILIELIDLKYRLFWEHKPQIISRELTKSQISDFSTHRTPTYITEINDMISNLNLIIDYYENYILDLPVLSHFQLRWNFENLGDLYINIGEILLKVPKDKIPKSAITTKAKAIRNAYKCYEKASKYERMLEIPGVGVLKNPSRLKALTPFLDLFKGNINTYNIREKMGYVLKEYPNYFNYEIKSYCWRSGGLCEFKEDNIYNIEEGDGVFISMNYNTKSNFEFKKYIEIILRENNLKLILKQDRTRSRSWTKEICCTIYNNKYSIIILDKYSPSVILELGIVLGMGRKAIILVNKNISKGKIEELLFSMISDYDCIVYSDVYEFYERFYTAINGIFFNILEQTNPKITDIFNQKEIQELDRIIKEGYK